MTSYGCKCQCENFAEHVGSGPQVMASAMPSRRVDANQVNATEKRWHRENDAFLRMRKAGYETPHLNGADIVEKNARTEIELERGKLYGEKAPIVQKMADELAGK